MAGGFELLFAVLVVVFGFSVVTDDDPVDGLGLGLEAGSGLALSPAFEAFGEPSADGLFGPVCSGDSSESAL